MVHTAQSAPHRRRLRDGTQHRGLVVQHLDIGDRLTTIREHRLDVYHQPAADLNMVERAPRQRLGELGRETDSVGQETDPDLPAWATTPVPSPVTERPDDHEVRFTCGVPSTPGS
jgi:hypothetical protein